MLPCRPLPNSTQRILVECPIQLKTDFGASDRDFEVFEGVHCLSLLVLPEQYTPVATYSNGEPGYVRTFNAPQYSVRAYESGFELKIADEDETFYYILQQISRLSLASDFRTKLDLTVFDFVRPESSDILISRASTANPKPLPFARRVGAIDPPQAQAGRVVIKGKGYFKGGFTVKFHEKEMRLG